MRRWMKRSLVLLAVLGLFAASAGAQVPGGPKGSLVIVGGALGSGNAEVYKAFIDRAGTGRIGIIPAASGKPVKYARKFTDDLKAYGVDPSRVEIIPLAVRNDKTTKDVDESKWADRGDDPAVASRILSCSAVWFLGGDQTRITKVLLHEDGTPTRAMKALEEIYGAGAVLGGTSAGAAVMSDVMIGGGNSLGALLEGFTEEYGSMDEQEYGPAFVLPGLGFFPWGVVDQHFDRKARLGRLVVVNLAERDRFPRGFGVDENTAMVVDPDQTFTVVGEGGVTVVDVDDAKVNGEGDGRAIRDVRLHFLATGDRYDLKTGVVTVLPEKYTTRGYEYFNVPGPDVTGSFSSNARIRNAVTFGLVDNAAVDSLRTYCFDEKGRGFEIRFRKIDETEGYWGYLDGLVDSYSATDVMMDVLPVRVLLVSR